MKPVALLLRVIACAFAFLLLAACAPAPTSAPAPTATPLPTATTAAPTSTRTATPVPTATVTPLPTPTSTPPFPAPLPSFTVVVTQTDSSSTVFALVDSGGSQIAVSDASGALTWNADNWQSLKDADKAQIVKWFSQRQKEGLIYLEVDQPGGSMMVYLPDKKNGLIPVKIGSGTFTVKQDKDLDQLVGQLNGKPFAFYGDNGWELGTKIVSGGEKTLSSNYFDIANKYNLTIVPSRISDS